ncbi:MAG: hypothetical protein J2P21_01135 [Chloracidobacterium sp.]|nr:hypothetical protein [Chloracidobacterium sp.]
MFFIKIELIDGLNEGGAVIDLVAEDLKHMGQNGNVDYEVRSSAWVTPACPRRRSPIKRGIKYVAL